MDDKYDAALKYASDLGAQHGRAAASWVDIDSEDVARRILAGLEEGDPAILDTLPSPDLSGQWAGEMTGPELVRDACDAAGVDHDALLWSLYRTVRTDSTGARDNGDVHNGRWFSDVCDAYETAFSDAAESEVSRRARYILEG